MTASASLLGPGAPAPCARQSFAAGAGAPRPARGTSDLSVACWRIVDGESEGCAGLVRAFRLDGLVPCCLPVVVAPGGRVAGAALPAGGGAAGGAGSGAGGGGSVGGCVGAGIGIAPASVIGCRSVAPVSAGGGPAGSVIGAAEGWAVGAGSSPDETMAAAATRAIAATAAAARSASLWGEVIDADRARAAARSGMECECR